MSSVHIQAHKRRFDDEELYNENLPTDFHNATKRFRNQLSPSGRCGSAGFATYPAYAVGSSAFIALQGLFPRMSEKVIADVLAEYGDNIDAAIKHLNDLALSFPDQQTTTTEPSTAANAAPSTEQQQQDTQQQQQQNGIDGQGPSTSTAAAPPPAAPLRTAEEWIDLMVEQMSAATSVDNARQRATQVLKSFEQAILQHADSQEGRVGELARENALLKRAVTIQNARLQELTGKETEATDLKTQLESAKARMHMLEVQNYSLQLHLKQAADMGNEHLAVGRKNPDVF